MHLITLQKIDCYNNKSNEFIIELDTNIVYKVQNEIAKMYGVLPYDVFVYNTNLDVLKPKDSIESCCYIYSIEEDDELEEE